MFHDVWELERFQTAKVTFKVIQGHWQWCHLKVYTRFPISVPQQLCLYLVSFLRIHSIFAPGPIRSQERIANRTLALPGAKWLALLLPGTKVLANFCSPELWFQELSLR